MSCSPWFVLASEGELVLMWWRGFVCGVGLELCSRGARVNRVSDARDAVDIV